MQVNRNKRRPWWPGMPTRRSQMFESLVVLYPLILAVLATTLMSGITAIRSWFVEP